MYIKLINETPTPYTLRQLRQDNPNVSFPKEPAEGTLARYDVYSVTYSDRPSYNPIKETLKEVYEQVDGLWYRNWVIEQRPAEEAKALFAQHVNAYRDERILGGFDYMGHTFDSDANAQKRISAATLLAVISNGAPGDYRWHGGDTDFVWITQDNQQVPMDAPQMIMFGKTAAEWERKNIFAARALKDMDPIPDNWKDEAFWA